MEESGVAGLMWKSYCDHVSNFINHCETERVEF